MALERLEEQWGALVKELLNLGAKLYAAKRYMGREGMAFHRFHVSSQMESYTHWSDIDLAAMSHQYPPAQIINIKLTDSEQTSKVD